MIHRIDVHSFLEQGRQHFVPAVLQGDVREIDKIAHPGTASLLKIRALLQQVLKKSPLVFLNGNSNKTFPFPVFRIRKRSGLEQQAGSRNPAVLHSLRDQTSLVTMLPPGRSSGVEQLDHDVQITVLNSVGECGLTRLINRAHVCTFFQKKRNQV